MPIPQEILSIERPKNTIVIAHGKDKRLYAVRRRIGCKNINGRHVPVNGPTIGHITGGNYVPIEAEKSAKVASSNIDLKDWASVVLCDFLSTLLTFRLLKAFGGAKVLDTMTYGKT